MCCSGSFRDSGEQALLGSATVILPDEVSSPRSRHRILMPSKGHHFGQSRAHSNVQALERSSTAPGNALAPIAPFTIEPATRGVRRGCRENQPDRQPSEVLDRVLE